MKEHNLFQFNIGRKVNTLREYIRIGAIFHVSLDVFSLIPGVKKKSLFNIVDQLQLKLNIEALNDYIIKDPELIGYRIERVITKAIEVYTFHLNED